MSFRSTGWGAIVVFVAGCGGPIEDALFEHLDSEQQAVESAYDRPVAAALQVYGPGAHAWVFACDSSNRLQRNIRPTTVTWDGWDIWDSTCVSVPSAAKWPSADTDAVAVYARYIDGHLWELFYPDATNDPDTAFWADLSSVTGFGNIAGDPVVADTDEFGRVSVVVRKASNNELWTFDWDGGWTTRKVLSSGSTAIRTTNTVAARAQKTVGWGAFITGRGLTSTNDTTGWVASRGHGNWSSSYTRESPFDHTPNGTPFPVTVPESFPIINNFLVARNGSNLQERSIDDTGAGWSNIGTCVPTGSPRSARNPYHELAVGDGGDIHRGFVRGGLAGSGQTNDLLEWGNVPGEGFGCFTRGGAMYSAPAKFEYATRFSSIRFSAVYKGTSDRVMFWDALNGVHTHLAGITLP